MIDSQLCCMCVLNCDESEILYSVNDINDVNDIGLITLFDETLVTKTNNDLEIMENDLEIMENVDRLSDESEICHTMNDIDDVNDVE